MHPAGSQCPQPHKGTLWVPALPSNPKTEAPPATGIFCVLPEQPWTSNPSAHHYHLHPLVTPAGLWHPHSTVISLLAFPENLLLPEDVTS